MRGVHDVLPVDDVEVHALEVAQDREVLVLVRCRRKKKTTKKKEQQEGARAARRRSKKEKKE